MMDGKEKKKEGRKEGAIASVLNTDEIEIRVLNGDGGECIKGGLVDEDVKNIFLCPKQKATVLPPKVRIHVAFGKKNQRHFTPGGVILVASGAKATTFPSKARVLVAPERKRQRYFI